MPTELNRNCIRPPSRHLDTEPNGYRTKLESSKLRQPGFGNRSANKSDSSGLCDNREENGNVQLRQPHTRGFGFRKTVAVNKSSDVRSSLPVQSSKLPTMRGSQNSVNSSARVPKTSSVPVLGKSRKEFDRGDYTRGSYRKIEDSVEVEQSKAEVAPDSPKKKSLLSRFGFKSSSFRLKGAIFKTEQPLPSMPVTRKASTLPQGARTPDVYVSSSKSRSPVRKFAAKRFSFIDSRNKCSDSRSSSFEIISDLSPDAMNAALKRPSVRPQTLLEANSQKFRQPEVQSCELSGPFLAMIISDGQCRLEQRVNEKTDVIYENQTEYIREMIATGAQSNIETPSSDSVEIRPYIETDIDSHSSVVDGIFATALDYEHSPPVHETESVLYAEFPLRELEVSPDVALTEEWKSSKVYQPSRKFGAAVSESDSSGSHSSRERDFLIDDEIIDQPCLLFSHSKETVNVPGTSEEKKQEFVVPSKSKENGCLEIDTPDGNDTLSACESIKSESSLDAWFRYIDSDKCGVEFNLDEETFDCQTSATLQEGAVEMKCDMVQSAGSCEGVIGCSETSSERDISFCVGEDLTTMKVLLLRLRNMLIQAETCNPFDAIEKNGLYKQLAFSDSRQNLYSLDSVASTGDVINALNEEILDLKRERVFLKEQLEEKDRLIKQLQAEIPRRNGKINGEAKWQLPPSGRRVKSEKKSEKCNVATQTDRAKTVIGSIGQYDRSQQDDFSSDDNVAVVSDEAVIDLSNIPLSESHHEKCSKEFSVRETKIPKSNCSLKVLPVEVHPAASGRLSSNALRRLSVNAK